MTTPRRTAQAQKSRRVVFMPLDSLVEAPRNPKLHDEEAIDASITRFGFVEPLVMDERTGRLVAGHGRLGDLRRRSRSGDAPPEGVELRDGVWCVPVVRGWASADDLEAEGYLLASNRTTMLAGWDDSMLAEMLGHATEASTLLGSGFTERDYGELLRSLPQPATDADLEAVPDPPPEPVSRLGDLWLLGPHRVLCGDATSPDAVSSLLAGSTPPLLLTDPPYCSGGFQEAGRSAGSVGTDAVHKQIANDRLSTRGYMALLKSVLALAPARWAYVFTDWRMWVNLFDAVESSGYGVRSMVVWDKGSPGMGRGWRSQHELVMWAAKDSPPFDKYRAGAGNVIQSKRTGNTLHTTQKPVDVVAQLLGLLDFAPEVYDPFAGSGTTLVAALQLDRRAFLMELDPAYVDVICRRFEELTGIVPVLEQTGEAVSFVDNG